MSIAGIGIKWSEKRTEQGQMAGYKCHQAGEAAQKSVNQTLYNRWFWWPPVIMELDAMLTRRISPSEPVLGMRPPMLGDVPERDSIKLELFSRCRYINLQAQKAVSFSGSAPATSQSEASCCSLVTSGIGTNKMAGPKTASVDGEQPRDGGQRPKVTDESLGCMANDSGREGGNMSALDRWLGETRKEEPWSAYSRTPDA
ncbi:hypothetical protein CC77DRAFT_1051469 [Alternaria alternata]|uniref:Uncharacterized protein n=1 Tax=Alternaria alternata TaxID=5599 RepID=A0A177DI87_ALTAL|nr:hypothetical protein CC77DRAFT_1051469 [Alternaria alternata]OAG19047.1 hypothetical protein CC77DRAFT_1051469 [Alternaria alternata]